MFGFFSFRAGAKTGLCLHEAWGFLTILVGTFRYDVDGEGIYDHHLLLFTSSLCLLYSFYDL